MKNTMNPSLPLHHYMTLPGRITSCGYSGPFGTGTGEHWYTFHVDTVDCLACLEIGWPQSHRIKEVRDWANVELVLDACIKAKW